MAIALIRSLAELVADLKEDNALENIAANNGLQFGNDEDPRRGAELLPKILRPRNEYTESQISYRSVVANSGSDYSPAQLNPGGRILGEFRVKLGRIDQAEQFTAADYQDLLDLFNLSDDTTNLTAQALLRLLNWLKGAIIDPMDKLIEQQRWQAIIDCLVIRTGTNGYREPVNYPNIPGHRYAIPNGTAASPTGWFDRNPGSTYDPYLDLVAVKLAAARKGLRLNRMFACYEVLWALQNHPSTLRRNNVVVLDNSNQFRAVQQNVDLSVVQGILRGLGLPNLEVYDSTYSQRTTRGAIEDIRYLERDTYYPLVITTATQRDLTVDLGADTPSIELNNVLGYVGSGTVLGSGRVGRLLNDDVQEDRYPPNWYVEGLEQVLPVIQMPEAIYVLKINKPTP